MKNFNLKSIFVTILLLLGASHAAFAAWTFNQGDVFYIDMSAITGQTFGCNIFVDRGSLYSAEIVSGSATRNGTSSHEFGNCIAPIIKVTFNQNTTIEDHIIVVKTSVANWSNDLTIQRIGSKTNNCYKVNSDGKTGSLTTYGSSGGSEGGSEGGEGGSAGGTIPKQIKGSFDGWNTHGFTKSGDLYSYTYKNLEANKSYEFVVVPQSGDDFKNKNITKESPSAVLEQAGNNATIQTDIAGDYKFTWDPAKNTITVTYPSSSSNPCFALHAEFLNWNNPIKFNESEDGKTASCTYTVSSTSSSEKAFGIRQLKSCDNTGEQAAWWYATGNTSITQTSTIQLYKQTTEGCSNPKITFNTEGEYTFTIEYSTNKLTVTYPSSTTIDECKLYYANESDNGAHTGAMDDYIVMEYDNVSAAYYADVTTTATYYCYRYQKGHSGLYAADWSAHPKGTEVIANGDKVDANKDVSGWGDKSVCYYKGTSGDNIRIWIDYANKKTWITQDVSLTNSYRLVYVEKNGGTIKKFHPSHIIKNHPEATKDAPIFDTVSMHVRLKLLNKKVVTGTTNVSYDTIDNDNDCEVWLQEFKESTMEWVTIQNINTKEPLTTNGVYNFIITQADGSATIEPTAIRPYTGRYYIRTDASDGGWHNYKQLSNYCYYTEYSRVYRGFDYYYCHWSKAGNIKYTIACDYSNCVSDTLAQEDHEPHNTFTDAHGTLTDNKNANVRFMWNSFDNTLDRAYIAGVGKEDNVFNLFLLSESGIYNMDGKTSAKEVKLDDQQNWVYCVDVKADSKARIKLRAVPYNGATSYSWFRGLDGNFSDENTEQLIEGKIDTRYTVRVIYDFKTDHLICAWIPDKDTITSNDVINADLMIIRTDQGEAAQLNFKPNQTKVTNITVAYCVLNLTKDHLNDSDKSSKERGCYWISFPFDVNLSDVFGCGKYGEDFIIQYYDGDERARNGCWADSPTYWKYITNPKGVVLKKGMGYVLVIDYEKILTEQFKHNNSSVNIYFPSSGPIDSINGKAPTEVLVPEHECTIKRNERYIYDSNWNIIGIPTWANIDQFGNPMVATQRTTELSQGGTATYTIGFYYAHDAVNNKWKVCNTKEVDFLSMYSYLVQWAGTIDWQEKEASGKHHPTLAPRRYAPAAEGEEEGTAPEQYTLRLTLNRGEQQLDHTYVRLQEGNVTTDFDLNYDMTKILNDGTNLYSLVGTNLIQCAANVQPLQEEAQTISIPLGVVADQDGLYTFSLPDGTEGMNVSIADFEDGTVHNLALGDYQTALTAGTYEGRFALEIQPRQEVSTGCEQTDAAGKSLRKVLIDGNLYILRDGKAYTAAGKEL